MMRGLSESCLIAIVVGCAAAIAAGAAEAPMQTSIPVQELDELYLDVPELESYTYSMLELGIRMGAAVEASLNQPAEEAGAAVMEFKDQYRAVAQLVPAWREHFDLETIDELAAAVESGAGMAAKRKIIGSIEDACTGCHVKFMVPVQARYRWGTFSRISIDGADGRGVDFHTIMLDLSNGLGALRGRVESGDIEAATDHFTRVKERFEMMEMACTACHEEPREYFIDARVKARLFRIGGLLRKGSTEIPAYTAELNAINRVSCLPCHQVHMPAAFIQQYWESMGQ